MPTPPGGYRAAHGRGLRPPDALSGRRALPPEAQKIRVVLDNLLNAHTGASLYRAFEPSEARRVLYVDWSSTTHPQARILAQPGGGGALGALAPMPLGAAHPRSRNAGRRGG